jgi:hypothetical protein
MRLCLPRPHESCLSIAAALLLPGIASAQVAPPAVSPGETLLEITATGRTTRVPDLATVRAGVVTEASTAAAAAADNATRMTRVVAALRAAGIASHDLSTAALQLQPRYAETPGQPSRVTGYQATNTVSVRFRDIARAGAVLDALVAQGANQIDGPTFALADPDAALDVARADAIARARARADLYARAAGLHVGRLVSISENGEDRGGSPPVMFRLLAQAAPTTPVLAGETEVSATVAVRFALR